MPRVIRYMAKAELWRNPLLRLVMEGVGTFPVERGRGDSSAVTQALALLSQGRIVAIFPQATSMPLRRRPFQRTAARLALTTGAPIVPVALIGTERILRPHRFKVGVAEGARARRRADRGRAADPDRGLGEDPYRPLGE
jgi:1-acyl-sn-glycerol-3-phosphate acyltransferase